MKTPKRKSPFSEFTPRFYTWEGPNDDAMSAQRWHRKNSMKQLKHTITRLSAEITELKNTIARLEIEKKDEFHRGHAVGYDLACSRRMF